jgi:hypothetical protein
LLSFSYNFHLPRSIVFSPFLPALFLGELQAVLVTDCEREDPTDRVAGGGNEEGQGEDRKREMKTCIKNSSSYSSLHFLPSVYLWLLERTNFI